VLQWITFDHDLTGTGQSVPHVHVHVLPRKPADFSNNDDVYGHLDRQNLHETLKIPEDRRPRTLAEMEAEAVVLRTLFPDNTPII
jgi:bis(5'-adenosyl)-triphosphatase